MLDMERLECYRLALQLMVIVDRIAKRARRRRPASCATLQRASLAVLGKIARSWPPGPRREWQREIDRALRAGRAARAMLQRLQRDDPHDADVLAAIEITERIIEIAPEERSRLWKKKWK